MLFDIYWVLKDRLWHFQHIENVEIMGKNNVYVTLTWNNAINSTRNFN